MIIEGKVKNKKIIIEVIISSNDILKKKKKYIYDTFKNINLDNILNKINNNELNAYVDVKVIKNGRIEQRYRDLFKSNSLTELLEILLIMFTNKEWYEVCKIISDYLNNINY